MGPSNIFVPFTLGNFPHSADINLSFPYLHLIEEIDTIFILVDQMMICEALTLGYVDDGLVRAIPGVLN